MSNNQPPLAILVTFPVDTTEDVAQIANELCELMSADYSGVQVQHAAKFYPRDAVLGAAMQAQYLITGYDNEQRRLKYPGSVLQNEGGHLEVASRVSELALVAHEYLQTPPMLAHNQAGDWPGVYEYEVSEPTGRWLQQNSTCTDEEFRQELEQRTEQWFHNSRKPT